MDFNNISAEINKIIRKEVIPSFKHRVKMGETVEFIGAVEFNQKHLNLSKIEIIPISLKLL
jgi:predicted lipoprotein